MGLDDSPARWFSELLVHKRHTPTEESRAEYGLPDDDTLRTAHDDLGCLLVKNDHLAYWQQRIKEALAYGDNDGASFAMRILSKYMRGIYR